MLNFYIAYSFPILLIWYFQYVQSKEVEHYIVMIQKASGEPAEESNYIVRAQSVTLFLCYSAYKLSIVAFNKAGSSPAACLDINSVEDQSGRTAQTLLRVALFV